VSLLFLFHLSSDETPHRTVFPTVTVTITMVNTNNLLIDLP
jgi:hypothetical protein